MESRIGKAHDFRIDRVIVDKAGRALEPDVACLDRGVRPDVFFIRDDGWVLGAPQRFEEVAYLMCCDRWIGWVSLYGRQIVRPMSEYDDRR